MLEAFGALQLEGFETFVRKTLGLGVAAAYDVSTWGHLKIIRPVIHPNP